MTIIITENEQELSQELGRLIEKASNEAINDHNQFYIGVSGGSLITFLANGLKGIKTDLSKWVIFFNDERVVPIDDPDSTFGAYKKDIVGKIPLKEEQFVQIKQGVSMALYFTEALPVFDMLLLGMGPDGHTCSLFPDHPLLEDDSRWVAPITDSPKPPAARVTITFPVINNAKACVFAMAGDGKADMLKRVLIDKEDFPVNRVKPKSGTVHWIIDKAAGKYLKN
ncbi:hypothetical protein RI129_010742 [Pyrocoelia pectoralis]|uniref:6-phosphogluconolactonase n=1 Tax=Pyrocoelia pectoralis TaxID=417401 RepID=A0AAN7V7I4_9COLE